MIQIIIHAFIENGEAGIVEVFFASADHEKVQAKYEELTTQHPDHYLAVYDLPLDTDLSSLAHYPSVVIGKEEFE